MGQTILVVEDNEDSRSLIAKVLARAGYGIIETESGEEAVSLARAVHPDLILMDLSLVGIDGLTATGLLKKDPVTRDVPVVALTAYAMEGDRERILGAGCDGYISKPVDVRKLPDMIATYLKGAQIDAK